MGRPSATLHPDRKADPDGKRPKLPNAEMDELVKMAWDAGACCKRAGNNHIKVFPVDGSRMIPIPSTPSDPRRTYKNKLRALQRAGIGV